MKGLSQANRTMSSSSLILHDKKAVAAAAWAPFSLISILALWTPSPTDTFSLVSVSKFALSVKRLPTPSDSRTYRAKSSVLVPGRKNVLNVTQCQQRFHEYATVSWYIGNLTYA